MTPVTTIKQQGYEALIYAIIHRAILDCFASPVGNDEHGYHLDDNAQSAFEFLSDKDNIYFPLIDVDVESYWTLFVKQMYKPKPVRAFSEQQREAFRVNHEIWKRHEATLVRIRNNLCGVRADSP
jgi:hypothetical protein